MGYPVEEERTIQVRRRAQHEAEEEACHGSSQGHQPLYERAVCVQGEAGIADRSCVAHEAFSGDGELSDSMPSSACCYLVRLKGIGERSCHAFNRASVLKTRSVVQGSDDPLL